MMFMPANDEMIFVPACGEEYSPDEVSCYTARERYVDDRYYRAEEEDNDE